MSTAPKSNRTTHWLASNRGPVSTHNHPDRFWERDIHSADDLTLVATSHGASLDEARSLADLIAAAPELLDALKEMREACCAAMRVIADLDTAERLGFSAEQRQQRFVDELKIIGIKDGFGVRAQDAIAKAEGR